tara:strand:+ start:1561 stop:3066 length:1506 start_codon:yes stop_codon:yes gene_type:complete
MYGEFTWWQGVVEDRYDPLKLGRCRVRILGYHTDNKQEGVGIPTADLPWATPMQPITSAAMNGIGTSPTGVVEGTWVFGFFRDGKNAQDPVMIGTFGGIPEDKCTPGLGFNDPTGKYPLQQNLNESDTNRLARGSGAAFPLPTPITDSEQLKDKRKYPPTAEDAPSLIHKRATRQKDTPTARAGDMSTSIDNTSKTVLYTETLWNEPNPRYGGTDDLDTVYLDSAMHSSAYPRNHVRMSEAGHVEEWDDTPSVERLHKYHKSGTFEEIQPDGTKVTKIVGNEYEITLTDKKVLINGTCEVTVGKDCRMLYKGDLVQEVQGDYHLHVHGDKRTKIHGNSVTEILADRKTTIGKEGAGNDELLVNLQQMITVNGDRTINLGAKLNETVTGDVQKVYLSTLTTLTADDNTILSNKNIAITAIENVGISTDTNLNIVVTGAYNQKITGVTTKHYVGAFHERWDGDKWTHKGANTYERHESGINYTCSGDPSRTGANSCTDVNTVT